MHKLKKKENDYYVKRNRNHNGKSERDGRLH